MRLLQRLFDKREGDSAAWRGLESGGFRHIEREPYITCCCARQILGDMGFYLEVQSAQPALLLM